LAQAGFTIISGLARGIDGCAHLGALQAKGRTLAVLAGGLAKIYPPEHTDLAEEIIQSGALITESAMRMEPMAGMFPARNRIISGLARAVVVVEAGNKSGALITASHAAEQGRDVFAIPGPVDSPASEGTLELIRKGAKIIRNADDILEDLRGIVPKKSAKKSEGSVPLPLPDLNEFQQRIWNFLSDGPKHVDELTRLLAVPVGELSSNLLLMEMKRIIRRLPGNTFERR
jgi:DNA processing protein